MLCSTACSAIGTIKSVREAEPATSLSQAMATPRKKMARQKSSPSTRRPRQSRVKAYYAHHYNDTPDRIYDGPMCTTGYLQSTFPGPVKYNDDRKEMALRRSPRPNKLQMCPTLVRGSSIILSKLLTPGIMGDSLGSEEPGVLQLDAYMSTRTKHSDSGVFYTIPDKAAIISPRILCTPAQKGQSSVFPDSRRLAPSLDVAPNSRSATEEPRTLGLPIPNSIVQSLARNAEVEGLFVDANADTRLLILGEHLMEI